MTMSDESFQTPDYPELARQIKAWARDLGFSDVRITRPALPPEAETQLQEWLALGRHGEMDYMQRHGVLRVRPAELVPGSASLISVRMNYWPGEAADARQVLQQPQQAYLARYALGRDYHKVLRNRLQKLAQQIESLAGDAGCRVFTDSAPLAEVALAAQAGLAWQAHLAADPGAGLAVLSRRIALFFASAARCPD